MRHRNGFLLGLFALTLTLPVHADEPVADPHFFEAPASSDLAQDLVDVLKYDNLAGMRTAGLEQAKLTNQPWSGWFYPLAEAGIANRYADPKSPKGSNVSWETLENYLEPNIGQGDVSDFSPAEKYDLLMGDPNFSMTRNMISVAGSYEIGGSIQGWLGYCSGWANAAMMLPRPKHAVVVKGRDGTPIQFLPSDIKALGALLFANGSYVTRMVGNLCQENPVQRDPETDRPDAPECRDTNPATWHIAVVNQIGVAHRSFVIDADPGYQVWNQPVAGYSYTYFNPSTGQPAPFEQARVKRSDFQNDKFAAFRAPETDSIIGVQMSLTFVFEKRPDANPTDNAATDETRVPVYKYDLELDANGKIIGGEWWSRLHPDVLWVAAPDSHPRTIGDGYLQGDSSTWDPSQPLPDSWARASLYGVSYLQPLGRVVEQLFAWASR